MEPIHYNYITIFSYVMKVCNSKYNSKGRAGQRYFEMYRVLPLHPLNYSGATATVKCSAAILAATVAKNIGNL